MLLDITYIKCSKEVFILTHISDHIQTSSGAY